MRFSGRFGGGGMSEVGLESGFRLYGAGGTRDPGSDEINRPKDKSCNEPGYAAKVVKQRTALASEEPAIAHNVQVKKRREHSKETDGQYGSVSSNGVSEAMGEPIQCLGQTRNTQNYDQISKQPRTKTEGVLLHARIHPSGERHITDLNQNDGQDAMRAGVGHRYKVNE